MVSDLTKCFLSGTILFSVKPSYLDKMKGREWRVNIKGITHEHGCVFSHNKKWILTV